MDWEGLATSAVDNLLSRTARLSCDVKKGDRTPNWDGHIFIHKDNKRTNDGVKAISIQVKGKAVSKAKKGDVTFPVRKVDLNSYLTNGGTIFFVIHLDKATGDTIQIYYASLLPYTISKLLSHKNNRTTISVKLRPFPSDINDIEELLLNFHQESIRQTGFAGKELPTIESLTKAGVFEGLEFHYTQVKRDKDIPFEKILEGKEITIYAKTKGNPAGIPVEQISYMTQVTSHLVLNEPVKVEEQTYYTTVETTHSADNTIMQIGSCWKMTFSRNPNENENRIGVEVKIQGTLSQRIKGLEFIIALFKAKEFVIGDATFPVNLSNADWKKFDINEYIETLRGYKRAEKVLSELSVTKDLELDSCTPDDYRKLNSLIKAIENEEPITGVNGDLPILVGYKFANIRLAMICKKVGENTYNIWDFFSRPLDVIVKDENNVPHPISQYHLLKADDYVSIDNLKLSAIIDDIKRIESQEFLIDTSNDIMLELLKAYDRSRNVNFLTTAKQINEWQKEQSDGICDEVLTLNELQIVARERSLKHSEKMALYKILEESSDLFYQAGAYLLLGEQEEATQIITQFDENAAKRFSEFPIYRFYNPKE